MSDTLRKVSFLKAYRGLCMEYGMFIGACGCCDSPEIEECQPGRLCEQIGQHIDHLMPPVEEGLKKG